MRRGYGSGYYLVEPVDCSTQGGPGARCRCVGQFDARCGCRVLCDDPTVAELAARKGSERGFQPPLAAPRRCRVDTMSDRPPGRPNKVWGGVGPTISETRSAPTRVLHAFACKTGGSGGCGAGERDFLGSIPRRQVGMRVTRSGDAGFRSGSAALRGNAHIDPRLRKQG